MTNEPIAVEEMRFTLYRYCLSLTRSEWDAEDLVQETCLRALPVMNGARTHPNPTAYLLRTARNIAVDQSRRKKRAERVMEAMKRDEAVQSDFDSAIAIEDMLGLLIRHLSPLQRTVFLLKELFGYKNAETAAKLQRSEGAVKAALHRARAAVERLTETEADGIRENAAAGKDSDVLLRQEADLLRAYAGAIRSGDPQALVVLANAENGMIDTVQAIGHLHRIGQRHTTYAVDGNGSSSVSMRFAA
ncbi:RNA polymerase sigma factor [Paenibacillus lycopersici]|uniref:RNA polymerase sigma factor n=1 Tax=Paenibacillus lycopersici TaxID=2704462 RepID=A0A6C0FTH5_9BACL|nr:RNA polymerase sigma factor [Paenibacillus lycopersici]QHT60458.1 RNA polymerase sigma factor [Paenibacillus lycopersici]